jgi:hypothetical protein
MVINDTSGADCHKVYSRLQQLLQPTTHSATLNTTLNSLHYYYFTYDINNDGMVGNGVKN